MSRAAAPHPSDDIADIALSSACPKPQYPTGKILPEMCLTDRKHQKLRNDDERSTDCRGAMNPPARPQIEDSEKREEEDDDGRAT